MYKNHWLKCKLERVRKMENFKELLNKVSNDKELVNILNTESSVEEVAKKL